MLAQYLPLKELQAELPLDQIEQLSAILRRLDVIPKEYDPYTDKAFLGRLYEAYYGVGLLAYSNRRRRLLEFLPQEMLTDLTKRLGVSSEGPFQELADRINQFTWGSNEQTATFLDFFGYPREFLPEPRKEEATSEWVKPYGKGMKSLYDYQARVFHSAFDQLEPPNARLLIQMPTGSGKTRTAMELVAAFLNKFSDRTVLWLAHSEELCEQAIESFQHVWKYLGQREVGLHRCWGSHTPTFPPNGPGFVVAGFPKLHSLRTRGFYSPNADLIVVDEAHMVLAPTFDSGVTWAQAINGRVVGLSATPGRSARDLEQNIALAGYFNGCIIGIETEDEGVIEYLQGRGILSRLEREPLHTNISFHLTSDEWKKLEEQLDYPREFLKRVAENVERNRIVIERLWQLAEEGLQTLVFAASVEQSRTLCAALVYRNIAAVHIDGTTSPEIRRASIEKFRRGELRFLTNYGVLASGFDAPQTDVVMIARPTKSIVLYSQMLGRGLRGPAVGGTATCRLVDVIDNVVDYSSDLDDVYDYFYEYWS